MASRHPVVVIPGLQGTVLLNHYQMTPTPIWGVLDMLQKQFFGLNFNDLALADSDVDFSDTVLSAPHQAVAMPYESLIYSLQARLEVPVYPFRYDWRRSFLSSGQQLLEWLEELQLKPMRSIPDWDRKFDFVCHSFGGLVLRSALASTREHPRDLVDRVVFCGVPHCGSLDAVDALVRGEAPIFGGRKELRKLTRTFPSAYELLPTFPGALIDQTTGAELNVFDVENWQRNVLQTPTGEKDWAIERRRLAKAAAALKSLPPVLSDQMLAADQCLSIIGLETCSTSVALTVKQDGPVENWFDFASMQRGIGDGVVPVVSAHLPGVDYVWLSQENAGALSLARLVSLHAFLPCFDEVHSVVARFFNGVSGLSLLPLGMSEGQYVSGSLPAG